MSDLKRVLIVEDDADYRRMLLNSLYMDYEVVEAENGEQAMEKILVHEPHAVILDLLLPKVDGFEVLKRIREYPEPKVAGLPVLILSNLSSNKDFLAAQNLHADAYYVKSNTSIDEFKHKLGEMVLLKYPPQAV